MSDVPVEPTEEEDGKGAERSAAARKAAQDRRAAEGKDPKSFGPGGNPEGDDDEVTPTV